MAEDTAESEDTSEIVDKLPDSIVQRLRNVRGTLLHLHKSLLEVERVQYERVSGRISSGELLQLVISDARFAWLRPISELIVKIDEMLGAEEPMTLTEARSLFVQVRLLLTASADEAFSEKYQSALQHEPAVVMAHAQTMNLLRNGEPE